jgi:hypothetical protein
LNDIYLLRVRTNGKETYLKGNALKLCGRHRRLLHGAAPYNASCKRHKVYKRVLDDEGCEGWRQMQDVEEVFGKSGALQSQS